MVNESKIDRIKSGKPYSLFDIIAILLSLVLCVTVIVVNCSNKKTADTLVIKQVAEGITSRYNLLQNQEIRIVLEKGEMIIKIEDGAAWIESSPCKGQDCVHMPSIRHAGESITCADCRIFITVEGQRNFSVI